MIRPQPHTPLLSQRIAAVAARCLAVVSQPQHRERVYRERQRQRVDAAIVRTGSAVVGGRHDPEFAGYWQGELHAFFGESIEQYPIEDSDPHVPQRWASWWGSWADEQRHESDGLDAGFTRALELDEVAS